jgi:uncharacterized protein with HEPN domain
MPSPSERDSWRYVEDMRAFCERALDYTKDVTREAFASDAMRYEATLRNLELLGEAATHVPAELRTGAPGIPWRQLIATRNRLIHAHLGIDMDTVWSILCDDIPSPHDELLELLATR